MFKVTSEIKRSVIDCIYSGVLETREIANTLGYSSIYISQTLSTLYKDYGINGNSQLPKLVWKLLKGQEFAK